uniref:hypothetical protein n=1 Tax=Nocardia cyriacigeorgica TaxID=135487 RepID=UPI0024544AE8
GVDDSRQLRALDRRSTYFLTVAAAVPLLGAALGIPRWRLIRWLMTGITLWCTVLLFASDAAFAIFGIG